MRILIADDHSLLRDTFKSYLERSELEAEVSAAASLPEAAELARQGPALELVLLDLDMPGMNGLAGLEVLRRILPGVPVVIVSALATPENVIEAMRAGAAGFIPKTLGAKAMLGALRLVLAGERYVPAALLDEARALGTREAAEARSAAPAFTAEEAHILDLLKKGQSNKEIARALAIEEYTVKYHLRGIFRKLGAKNRTQAVMIAIDRNLP